MVKIDAQPFTIFFPQSYDKQKYQTDFANQKTYNAKVNSLTEFKINANHYHQRSLHLAIDQLKKTA